ncbi:hypothetical protein J3A83DRAFT_4097019 [Scleroderma citrinum]
MACHNHVCSGRHVGVRSRWTSMACILVTLRVTNTNDEHGNAIAGTPEFTTGLTTCVPLYRSHS